MKTIARAIWNGPFAAPPVQQPVSVGWVFLKIMETFWRTLVVVALLAVAAALAIYASDRLETPLSQQLALTVQDQHPDCADTPAMPLKIAVTNNSNERIGEWTVQLHAYERGRSTDIAEFGFLEGPEIDWVIEPGQTLAICAARPELTREPENPVTYTASASSAAPLSPNYRSATPPPLVRTKVPPAKAPAPVITPTAAPRR